MEKIRFLSTVWTIIEKAKQRDQNALQEIFLRYKKPVISFLSKRGFSKEAEDLAQEVFLKILDEDLLKKADKSKGRFRTFILAVTKNIIGTHLQTEMAQKRGADKNILSLEASNIDQAASEQENEEFDKFWLLNLMEKSYVRLEDECKKNGLLYHIALKLYLDHDLSYQQIADQMDKSFDEVKNYIHRAKQKIKGYIQDEIAFYSESIEEYNEELKHLSKYLKL